MDLGKFVIFLKRIKVTEAILQEKAILQQLFNIIDKKDNKTISFDEINKTFTILSSNDLSKQLKRKLFLYFFTNQTHLTN